MVDAQYNVYSVRVDCSVNHPFDLLEDVLRQCDAQNPPYPTGPSQHWPIVYAGTQIDIAAADMRNQAFVACLQAGDTSGSPSDYAAIAILLLALAPAAVIGVVCGLNHVFQRGRSAMGASVAVPTGSERPLSTAAIAEVDAIELSDMPAAAPPPAYQPHSEAVAPPASKANVPIALSRQH